MENLREVITDFELEDMEDSLSSLMNKVIELLNKEEIKANDEVRTNLELMYERLSEATEVFGNFEYKLEKENNI
jgi:predicted metal-dependent hydrolase